MKIPNSIVPEIYKVSVKVYEGELTLTDGADWLSQKFSMKVGSMRIYINDFKSLRDGKEFKRTLNSYSMDYFIQQIGIDFGENSLANAITALGAHIKYYESCHSGQLNSLRKVYQTLSGKKLD